MHRLLSGSRVMVWADAYTAQSAAWMHLPSPVLNFDEFLEKN